MTENPFTKFRQWFETARQHTQITEPTAMCLATANAQGMPSARIVLLKGYDENGFVFFTNLESHKSTDIKQNPHAALCFYWMPLEKQIRIEGTITQVSDAEADTYFASRPRASQIGAWSSQQSRPLAHRSDLLKAIENNTSKFEGGEVPRPDFWSGWRLKPERIEFWQQIEFRLHDRELFTRKGADWHISKLYP